VIIIAKKRKGYYTKKEMINMLRKENRLANELIDHGINIDKQKYVNLIIRNKKRIKELQ
jgi:hypothetical protein